MGDDMHPLSCLLWVVAIVGLIVMSVLAATGNL